MRATGRALSFDSPDDDLPKPDDAAALDLLLVSMPWAAASRPNLGLSVLCTQVRQAGFSCRVIYPNLDLAAALGVAGYEGLAETSGLFAACEHVFSLLLFDPAALASDEFLGRFDVAGRNPFRDIFHQHLQPFVERTVSGILARQPRCVGFGCTFNQTLPALAVARRLKQAAPDITILFGGSSVHGSMGVALAGAFSDCVDHVFLGEADVTLPAFLACRGDAMRCRALPGITVAGQMTAPALPTADLAGLGAPDFDDYFVQLEANGFARSLCAALPYESSRGCWWGERHHCVFCGLNNEGMRYRRKPLARLLDEMLYLARRHRCLRLMAADNILENGAAQGLLPAVSELGLDLDLFYEVKGNASRDQVAALADAGVRWVQPGVESFSSPVLKRMRKGISALQNVHFLRLCQEFGITPSYNILLGFPGESVAEYVAMERLIAAVQHLPPPMGPASPVQVHRFSPFFDDGERLGIGPIAPAGAYRHLIPPEVLSPADYAYFFERLEAPPLLAEWLPRINVAIDQWRATAPVWRARLGPGFIEIDTGAQCEVLDRPGSLLFLLADRPRGRGDLLARAARLLKLPEAEVEEVLGRMLQGGWLVEDADSVLSVVAYARPHRRASLLAWARRWLGVSLASDEVVVRLG